MKEVTAWVIVLRAMRGNPLRYWTGVGFSASHLQALRFLTAESAEQEREERGIEVVRSMSTSVEEHKWLGL